MRRVSFRNNPKVEDNCENDDNSVDKLVEYPRTTNEKKKKNQKPLRLNGIWFLFFMVAQLSWYQKQRNVFKIMQI